MKNKAYEEAGKALEAVAVAPALKAYNEAKKALEATPEFKAKVEAWEAVKATPAWKAWKESDGASGKAWDAVKATPEFKDYLKVVKTYEAACKKQHGERKHGRNVWGKYDS